MAIHKHCKARASNLYELSLPLRFSPSYEKTGRGNGLCKLSQIPAVNDILDSDLGFTFLGVEG